MPTIKDVAASAGVSLATASRALSGAGPVSPDAHKRVLAAAKSLDYRVNKAAQSLRTNRTDALGLLISDVRNPFFSELAYVIEQAAAATGQSIITVSADESAKGQHRALQALARQRVDGLIVVPQRGTLERFDDDLPMVFLDRRVEGLDIPVIESDHDQGMRLLIDHLVGAGHKDIALITGPQASSSGRARLTAARRALAEHGIEVPAHWVQSGDFQLASGQTAAKKIFDAPALPSAIVAGDNLMAVGALLEARERGLRIGRDIALVSFDDAPWFPVLDPPLTVVAQDVAALGEHALRAVNALIAGEHPTDTVLPTRLIVRDSCPPAERLTHD